MSTPSAESKGKNPNKLISGKLQQSTSKISALSQVNNSQQVHSALEQIKKNEKHTQVNT